MMSKHKMAPGSVNTFVQRVLGEIAVCYDNVYIPHKGQGDAYILNYKTNARGFALIPKCKSGFVWWDYFASPHHAN